MQRCGFKYKPVIDFHVCEIGSSLSTHKHIHTHTYIRYMNGTTQSIWPGERVNHTGVSFLALCPWETNLFRQSEWVNTMYSNTIERTAKTNSDIYTKKKEYCQQFTNKAIKLNIPFIQFFSLSLQNEKKDMRLEMFLKAYIGKKDCDFMDFGFCSKYKFKFKLNQNFSSLCKVSKNLWL